MKFSIALIATLASSLVSAAPLVARGGRTDRTSVQSRQAWASRALINLQQEHTYGTYIQEAIAAYEKTSAAEKHAKRAEFLNRQFPVPVVYAFDRLIKDFDENAVVEKSPSEVSKYWASASEADKEAILNKMADEETFTEEQAQLVAREVPAAKDISTALGHIYASPDREEFFQNFWALPHTLAQIDIVDAAIVAKQWGQKATIDVEGQQAFWQLSPRFRDIIYEINLYYYASLGNALDATY